MGRRAKQLRHETSDATRKLSHAASVSPVFIELTNVAVTNQMALVHGEGTPPDEVRDLVAYSDAYVPLADELEALAQFIRYSTTAARNVADMRRALGRQRKPTPEEAAKNAADRAARAAAKAGEVWPAPATTEP